MTGLMKTNLKISFKLFFGKCVEIMSNVWKRWDIEGP